MKLSDRAQLEQFKDDSRLTGPITEGTFEDNRRMKSYHYALVQVNNEQIVTDLSTCYGITPDKSKTFIPPAHLETPSYEYAESAKAFIIGFTDGDGSIFRFGPRRALGLGWATSNKETLDWLKGWLDFLTPGFLSNQTVAQVKNHFQYSIRGKKAEAIRALLNTLEVPKMKRKWNQSQSLEKI